MITYKIHLIRTGKTGSRSDKRYVGRHDVPLSGDGVEELTEMAAGLKYPPAEIVFTSPLSRCVQTADILYPEAYTETLDGLTDMSLGGFEGKSFEELRGNEAFSLWIKDSLNYPPPGGEDVSEFTRRIISAADGIFRRMMDERITNAAAVTHSGVIMALLAAIGLPQMPLHRWAVGNGEGYTLLFTPQMWMRDGATEVFRRLPGTIQSSTQQQATGYGRLGHTSAPGGGE